MDIQTAQRDVQSTYLRGTVGQAVSGLIWLASAILADVAGERAALSLPVIGAASLHNINWFYPAFMVILGVHYMPFIFLYGMWEFGMLSAILIGAGVAIGRLYPNTFATGGWFTAAVLLLFAALVQIKPAVSRYRQV
jgi:hypothetical protein